MAKRKEAAHERKVCVTIRAGRKKLKLESTRYWEIVGELQWLGTNRPDALDAAKWCAKAKPGDSKALTGVEHATGNRFEITMEVTDE